MQQPSSFAQRLHAPRNGKNTAVGVSSGVVMHLTISVYDCVCAAVCRDSNTQCGDNGPAHKAGPSL